MDFAAFCSSCSVVSADASGEWGVVPERVRLGPAFDALFAAAAPVAETSELVACAIGTGLVL